MQSIWEAFVSSRADKIASASTADIAPLVDAFVAEDRESFRAGIPLVKLAKESPKALLEFVTRTLSLRTKYGSNWVGALRYYTERNAAFREVFVSAASENPITVAALHESLEREREEVRGKHTELIRLLGRLAAARDLFKQTYVAPATFLWWNHAWSALKLSLQWDFLMQTANKELACKDNRPYFWPFGNASRIYRDRCKRLKDACEYLSGIEKECAKRISESTSARPTPSAQCTENVKNNAAPKLNEVAGVLIELGLIEKSADTSAYRAPQKHGSSRRSNAPRR